MGTVLLVFGTITRIMLSFVNLLDDLFLYVFDLFISLYFFLDNDFDLCIIEKL